MRLISQLFNGVSIALQKLLKYFNGTVISTFFVPSFPVEPVSFCLSLNEALSPGKSTRVPSSSFKAGLHYCHKLLDVFW